MAAITITKEVATDSEKVASSLAQKLGWEYIGEELVAQVAKELKISKSEAEGFRRTHSRLIHFIDKHTYSLIQKVLARDYGSLDEKAYFNAVKRLVENIYSEGDAIIHGWAGQYFLQGKSDVLHVRIRNDEESKIDSVMSHFNLDPKAASDYINKEEENIRRLSKHYFKQDLRKSRFYDLVIDMGATSVETAVDMICDILKYKS